MGENVAISVESYCVKVGAHEILQNLTVNVQEHEILGLLGSSGSGKSTLLNAMADVLDFGRGAKISGNVTLQIEGKPIHPLNGGQVGYVFQDLRLFDISVSQNICFGLVGRRPSRNLPKNIEHLCDLFQISHLLSRNARSLSGGEGQRVAWVRALANDPPIVLMDEPLSNIDASLRNKLRVQVRRFLVDSRKTGVIVTHDFQECAAFTDRIAVLSNGRVVQIGLPSELYWEPRTLEVARLTGSVVSVARVRRGHKDAALELRRATMEDCRLEKEIFGRPESFQVTGQKGANILGKFTVVGLQDVGNALLVHFDREGSFYCYWNSSNEVPRPGKQVFVSTEMKGIWVAS